MRYMLSYALSDEAAKAFRKEHQDDEIVDEVPLNDFIARIRDYVMYDAKKSAIPADADDVALAVYDTISRRIDAVVVDKAHSSEYRLLTHKIITVD